MIEQITGFQYTVSINQCAAIHGKFDLDVIDLGVIDAITFLCVSDWVKKKMVGDKISFRLDWEMIPKRLPCFGLNSRSSVKSRLSKLVQRGFLTIDETNVKTRESWYCFGASYQEFQNMKASINVDGKGEQPSTEKDANSPPKRTQKAVSPSTVVDDYDNTSLDNTSLDSFASNAAKKTKSEIAIDAIEADKLKRKKEFEKSLIPFLGQYDKTMLRNFADYWTESNYGKKKMRFQNEEFFDIPRRLATWYKRSKETFQKQQEKEEGYKMPKNLFKVDGVDFSEAAKKMSA